MYNYTVSSVIGVVVGVVLDPPTHTLYWPPYYTHAGNIPYSAAVRASTFTSGQIK